MEVQIRVVVRLKPLLGGSLEQEDSVVRVDRGETSDSLRLVDPSYRLLEKQRGAVAARRSSSSSSSTSSSSSSSSWEHSFAFDRCFPGDANQAEVYELVGRPALDKALLGLNATIFAYGQTGSGKTHTVLGSPNVFSSELSEEEGLVPRLCKDLFEVIESRKETFSVTMSFFEIYNERVRDLLRGCRGGEVADPPAPGGVLSKAGTGSSQGAGERDSSSSSSSSSQWLRVREHPAVGTFAEGLLRFPVSRYEEVHALLTAGAKTRSTAETSMNEHSSRSHSLFVVTVEQRWGDSAEVASTSRVGTITLCDLAGSERASMSGCVGERLREAASINRSLSALSEVIKALSDGHGASSGEGGGGGASRGSGGSTSTAASSSSNGNGRSGEKTRFVPYRNSVLTRLLKQSLGGNSATSIVATISQNPKHHAETLSTLRYVKRAKRITNSVSLNFGRDGDLESKELRGLRATVRALTDQLGEMGIKLAEADARVTHAEARCAESERKFAHAAEAEVKAKVTEAIAAERERQALERRFADAALKEARSSVAKHKEAYEQQLNILRKKAQASAKAAAQREADLVAALRDLRMREAETKEWVLFVTHALKGNQLTLRLPHPIEGRGVCNSSNQNSWH